MSSEYPSADVRELFDDQIISQIHMLRSDTYRDLSKTHREYLEDLEAEARTRKLRFQE